MQREDTVIFVVGNSRSGTTMLGRILGAHPEVFTFHELQVLDSIVSSSEFSSQIPVSDIRRTEILRHLFFRQRSGLYAEVNSKQYCDEIASLASSTTGQTASSVYKSFLYYETKKNGKRIACEQSPYYLSYVNELEAECENSVFINMVRDPRDVAISQKNKWKRNSLGDGNHPLFKEVLRSWANYHPYITSKIWSNSIKATERHSQKANFSAVKFENLVANPEEETRNICGSCGIDFFRSMLNIPVVGSSQKKDRSDQVGFDTSRIDSWKSSNSLSSVELDIIQSISGDQMSAFGYTTATVSRSYAGIAFQIVNLFFKGSVSLILNVYRSGNIIAVAKRRLNLR